MGKLWADIVLLLRESTLIQGSVTLAMVTVICYATVTGVDVGKDFWAVFGLIIGFWFGSKSQQQATIAMQEALRNVHTGASRTNGSGASGDHT